MGMMDNPKMKAKLCNDRDSVYDTSDRPLDPSMGGDIKDVGKAVKRVPVEVRYDALHPTFLHMMARVGGLGGEKYGDPLQYVQSRLEGNRGPVNHMYIHLMQYRMGHDHPELRAHAYHLAAIAYNAMMEYVYISQEHDSETWEMTMNRGEHYADKVEKRDD